MQHSGEDWTRVDEAAKRLGVTPAHIHRRAPRFLETRRLGDHFYVRTEDVKRWQREGLPYPEWEDVAEGKRIPLPAKWATLDRSNSPDGATAFVAIKPLQLDGRRMERGDVLAAGEPLPDGHLIAQNAAFAELPVGRGVLGALRHLAEREALLQMQLAVLAVRWDRRQTLGDAVSNFAGILVDRGFVTEAQIEAARKFESAPVDIVANAPDAPERFEKLERDFLAEKASSLPRAEAIEVRT